MSAGPEIRAVFKNLDRIIIAVFGILLLLYLFSGIYVVEANQMGVLFRFGARKAVVPPGIGYRLPWPVDRVRKVNVKEMQRIEVGFWPESGQVEELLPYCITGDKNIIHNRYVIQYRIADASNFLLKGARVKDTLYALAQAAILEAVAEREVDPILTTGKVEIQRDIEQKLRNKLDELGLKIAVLGVERQFANPPNFVKDAFQDVVNAREEERTRIHEANDYRNQEIPKANGEADSIIQQAEAYKVSRISSARGESDRFIKLYDKYKSAPAVTRHRLLVEMIEQVLPRTKVMVLATDKQGKPIRIKILQAPVPTTPRLME